MKNRTCFLFHFDSSQDAALVAQSLSPEVTHKIPKSNVSISVDQKTLSLIIESDEVSSLRAACNSYLRWIQTALSVKQLV